jgi:HK97 family phage major capsid protein
MTSLELRDKRAGVIAQARKVMEVGNDRETGPTSEDQAEFDRHMDEANKIKARYESMEKLETAERELDSPIQRTGLPLPTDFTPEGSAGNARESRRPEVRRRNYLESAQYREVFDQWFTNGEFTRSAIPVEFRDTILGTDTKGGYLSLPIQLANEVVKQCYDLCFVRQNARVITLGEAKALGIPQLGTRMADANWTTEVQAVTEDTTQAFTRRDLTPTLLSKLCKISIRMLYGANDVESFVTEELGYKFGITEEKAYLTGTGSAQPLGIFVASANGIPAARDVSTGNTTTAVVVANLYEMKYSLKAPYRNSPTCRWMWSRTAINSIMQFKDSQNRYLWEPSLQAGQPDRLLNIMVSESEYVPNTFTTGLYVGAIGDLRYYWIAQTDSFQIQRLVERYADTNEVGFIGRWYLDGSPVLGEAFARSKLA